MKIPKGMKEKNYSNTFYRLKKVNFLDVELHLDKDISLNSKEIIELTYHYVKEYIKSIKADNKLKKKWLKLNDNYREAYLSITRTHLFKSNTGSGKTVTSILWVKYLTLISNKIEGFVILSPTHEHGTDNIENELLIHAIPFIEGENFLVIKGKKEMCTKRFTKINQNVTLSILFDYKIPINEYCDNECDLKEECIYVRNRSIILAEDGTIKNWIGAHRQISYILPIFLYHSRNIILIIDEDFTDSIKNHYTYNITTLTDNIDFLNILIRNLKPDVDEDYKTVLILFKRVLTYFRYSLRNPIKEIDYNKVKDILNDIDTFIDEQGNFMEEINNHVYHYIKSEKIDPFKYILNEIINYLKNLVRNLTSDMDFEKWIKASFYIKKRKLKTKENEIIYHELTFLYYDKYNLEILLARENLIKIIVNDATANKLILEYLLESESVKYHIEKWSYRNVEFHQLLRKIDDTNRTDGRTYAHYPKASFLFKNTFNALINDLKAILEKHKDEKVLVVAREITSYKLRLINGGIKFSDYILSTLINKYNNIIFEDYPLKGTNKYSNINVVVILGRPELPQTALERQADLIGYDHKAYRKYYSTDSIIQAIGRITRGSEHKYVYLLTGFNLNKEINKSIKTYTGHKNFQKNMFEDIKIRETKEKKNREKDEIFKYIKENKYITPKQCENILNLSRYKSDKILNNFERDNMLKIKEIKNKHGRKTNAYFMNTS